MKKTVSKYLLLLSVLFSAGALSADDSQASKVYAEGRNLYLANEYYDAAKKFDECRYLTSNPTIRANSLKAQIAAYRMCKLYYREFTAIEELLQRYPGHVDAKQCNELIAREFEIAKLFRQGYREPAFWVFRWVPYLVDIDRTAEIYSAALERAPYSTFAPEAHMQLAIHYDTEHDAVKSVAHLREIVEKHPDSAVHKHALLALANGLFTLAGKGDGDSRYINEAVELFRQFCQRYPDASEIEFARIRLAKAKDIQAKKLFEIAEFYRKSGRSDVAERYLAQLMSNYPDSRSAGEAEKTLVEISDNYLPGMPVKIEEPRLADLKSYNIPANTELLLISPGDKNSPFLQEVPDLRGDMLENVSRKEKGENAK